ncbi:glycoside hydrolase family 5 protein [Gillisia sp. M10.2A]|uniref:Glycoside hydrolase family 5 protein n=1 Tax=Gillisia lutea TaxID=2909668 RepID=A0ABS9EI97_9FLAO|nr:glycoside hydrolase family 5 protein [Gillisia lutea]MCF4101176.1 glycoside hydrolase family 5 protein [Gillisia lutea]
MKKSSSFLFIIILSFLSTLKISAQEIITKTPSPVTINGQLNIEGRYLLNEKGEQTQLRGMSLFWSQWQPQFYNYKTLALLKNTWNIDVVRAAMAVENNGYLINPDLEKQKITRVIDAAIELGLYVIVDWHDHHAEDHTEQAKLFFSEIAQQYAGYPNIIYEIYNEPLQVSWTETLKPYHEELIATIRKYDPDNIIVCGTPNWSQRVDLAALDPISGTNIAYTLHYYAATHKQELRDIAQIAIDKDLALFVTEFGTSPASGDGMIDKEESNKWWDFLDKNKLSWCNWSLASKNESSAAFLPGTKPCQISKDSHLSNSGRLVKTKLFEVCKMNN